MKFFIRMCAYLFTFFIFVLPVLAFAYLVQFRAFMIAPAFWFGLIFFRGISKKPDGRIVHFEVTTNKKQ